MNGLNSQAHAEIQYKTSCHVDPIQSKYHVLDEKMVFKSERQISSSLFCYHTVLLLLSPFSRPFLRFSSRCMEPSLHLLISRQSKKHRSIEIIATQNEFLSNCLFAISRVIRIQFEFLDV